MKRYVFRRSAVPQKQMREEKKPTHAAYADIGPMKLSTLLDIVTTQFGTGPFHAGHVERYLAHGGVSHDDIDAGLQMLAAKKYLKHAQGVYFAIT